MKGYKKSFYKSAQNEGAWEDLVWMCTKWLKGHQRNNYKCAQKEWAWKLHDAALNFSDEQERKSDLDYWTLTKRL